MQNYFRNSVCLHTCFQGCGGRKDGIETTTPLKKRNSGLFLISGYGQIHTFLGISHLNACGSPQTSAHPFHQGHELTRYLLHGHLLQGSVTNILKERARLCTAFP